MPPSLSAMKAPPLPDDEDARLVALRRYAILDTEAEKGFDQLAALAARICETPIALISLVDESRQWFKSKVGLATSETPRASSFCGHAILGSELMIVPDTLADPRFVDNPLVTSEPHIRFYAGAVLMDPDGAALGTLCVIDRVPRELRTEQQDALRMLADQVVSAIRLRRETSELARSNIERERLAAELRASEAQLRDLVEGSVQGIVIDRDGKPVFANQTFADIFGFDNAEEVLRMDSLDPLYTPEALEQVQVYRRARVDGSPAPTRYEFQGVKSNGARIWVETRIRVIVWQGRPAVQSTLADVTERKEMEQALAHSNAELEAFAYSVAHDLKAPLRAMQGFSQALAEDYGDTLDDNEREYLHHISTGATRMGMLIDALLQYSRLGRGELVFEHIDMDRLFTRVLANLVGGHLRIARDGECAGQYSQHRRPRGHVRASVSEPPGQRDQVPRARQYTRCRGDGSD